jgi:hypothetical protein
LAEVLYKINITADGRDSLKFLQKILPASYKREKNRMENLVTSLGLSCKEAYQSKVPIDTKTLRNQGIGLEFASDNLSCEVVIEDLNYTNSRGRKVNAIELAYLLDDGAGKGGVQLRRTQSSQSISPYSSIARRASTANWISAAKNAFAQTRRRILSGGV